MDYLFGYIENKRLHGAPRFKTTVVRSFYLKLFLLTFFLPFDLLYFFLTRGRRRHLFDAVIFSEKYKDVSTHLRGSVAVITVPSLSFMFNRPPNIYYLPASIFFTGTFVSIFFKRILIADFLRIRCNKLVLHTDGLLVPRYLLKCLIFKKSICIQHGEFKILNDVYDGLLCDENIVLGPDQAELFKAKGYHGIIHCAKWLDSNRNFGFGQVNFSFDQIVLVGQGYHVNDLKLHYFYQKRLSALFRALKLRGFSVVYRPHPSEFFIHYFRFFLSREKTRSPRYINLGRLYVGTESTLLRKVRELGGASIVIDELDEVTLVLLQERFSHITLRLSDTLLDEPFISFAAEVINSA